MKTCFYLYISILSLVLLTVSTFAQTATLPSGSGTAGDPYLIATLNNLYWVTQDTVRWSKVYKQTADIDASTTSTWDGSKGFSPIGNLTKAFTGSYDGQSYTISNLFINRTVTGISLVVALFGYTNGATITNVKLASVNITANTDINVGAFGALIGYATGGTTVVNCSSSGSVTSSYRWPGIGGLVGYQEYACSITNCSSSCTVSGTGNNPSVGGLIGSENYACTINSSYSTGTVSVPSGSGATAGGLIADQRNGMYNSTYCSITNCYSTSTVSGGSIIGGLVANQQSNTAVTNCYSTGSVTGGSTVGGLMGSGSGVVTNSFWDKQTSGQTTSGGGTGKTTAEMKTSSTFTSVVWDGSLWNMGDGINNGYPYLDWQNPSGTPLSTIPTAVLPSGSGTVGDPYQIVTLNNLYWVTQDTARWRKVYKQTADIDASTTSTWDGGKGFSPIGNNLTTSIYFTGSYNGQSYAISNLFINRTNTGLNLPATVGLFGYAVNATITNVKLVNVNITGDSDYGSAYVGALVGCSQSTAILNCSSTGSVTSPMRWAALGGLIGTEQVGSSTTNCYSSCIVTGTGSNADVGGLVGQLWYSSTISSSYSTGAVSSTNNNVGGLIGAIDDVTSISYDPSSIINCYSTGSVSGGSYAGGLVGYTGKTNSTITNCYSTGSVSSGSGSRGGLIGGNTGTITNCFWDKTTSGQLSSSGGTGKTTAEMKTQSTFLTAGWDGSIWNMGDGINSGYPYLKWQNPSGTPLSALSGQWTKAGLSGKNIYGIYSNGASMFIGTDANGLYKGTGADSNWIGANTGLTSTNVMSISGISSFLYAGTGGGVFRSDDSAKIWTVKNTGLTTTFVRTIAIRGTGLYAGTEGGGAFSSLDNAGSWNPLSISPSASTIRTIIVNNQVLYAGTFGAGVFISTDAGSNWNAPNIGLTDLTVRALAFVGTNLFAGTPSGVFLSTNSGGSWTLVNTGLTTTSVETFAVSGSTLYAGTGGGGVFKTTNNGTQWTALNTGLTNLDVRYLYSTSTTLYAGTLGGGLFKAAISPTSVKEENGIAKSFTLAQNYPNPFNPSTTINFTLAEDSHVSLKVFDMLGREVQTLVNGEMKAGEAHSIIFDASKLSSGLYFYRLETGKSSLVKKLMLLK
jgi:hypothetical protein